MPETYDLTQLDPNTFEHMVNSLALCVLGAGHTGFGPGSDGGRDGYFEGKAPYPSETDQWSGRWYIQCKFHKPHLSKDPQKWLLERIQEEIDEFKKTDSKRTWPNNWIIATNIDPSGAPMTGAFDQARKLVSEANSKLRNRFHIWGGRKILGLLSLHSEISSYYKHFLTPGHILTTIYEELKDARAEVDTIIRFLIVKHFDEQKYTKLEQAGYSADTRPGIHRLFVDLPFRANDYELQGLATAYLVQTSAKCHRVDVNQVDTKEWRLWRHFPSRARVWFLRGGPGQGKSTIGQYFCQIQRAALILQKDAPSVLPREKAIALEIKEEAEKTGFWPTVPRIPINIELKDFAQWYGQRKKSDARGVLTYLAEKISTNVEQPVLVGTLKRALGTRSWVVVFDGLDEVPQDVKDLVATEISSFIDGIVLETDADVLAVCTSRPQGYSGQFSDLDGPTIDLISLSSDLALKCAKPVIELGRSEKEAREFFQTLTTSIQSNSVRELMTTPLQAHIMAVVVRDGGRPPERRWQLYTNFYQVIKKREANRDLPDKRLAKLLREENQLLKSVHNRLGFVLHARAETSEGAQTHLNKGEFKELVADAVSQMMESDIDTTINVLMDATTERLVLVNTPDDGNHVRFDIRPLQEFFAAEFLYESVKANDLRQRLELIAGDSHWREVMHFLLSALVENDRKTELSVAIQVLEHLNEGDDESCPRSLNRRLGRGALLAARLFQEGVLEQDRRIRQQFRRCLEPIEGFTDAKSLEVLLQVHQPNSFSWLINFLVDCLRESNRSENVGAAIVLSIILSDDHVLVDELKNLLHSAPPNYTAIVIDSVHNYTARKRKPETQSWFLEFIIEVLTKDSWASLGESAIKACLKLLKINGTHLTAIAKANDFSLFEIELLNEVISYEPSNNDTGVDNDYGIIKCKFFTHDWTTKTFNCGSWTRPLPRTIKKKGILEVAFRIIQFAQKRSLRALNSIIDIIKYNPDVISALPRHLFAYLPFDEYSKTSDQIDQLRLLSNKDFQSLMNKGFIGHRRVYRPSKPVDFGSEFTISQWKDLLEDSPTTALLLWGESVWNNISKPRPTSLDNIEIINDLVDKIVTSPWVLLNRINIFGRLLAKATPRKAELRRALIVASSDSVDTSSQWYGEFHPFKVNLPSEASLIPHLLYYLINFAESEIYLDWIPTMRRKTTPKLSEIVNKLVGPSKAIDKIANDTNISPHIRVAAAFISLLRNEDCDSLKSSQSVLLDNYTPEIKNWYFTAIRFYLSRFCPKQNPTANIVAGNALEFSREHYKNRQELDGLLRLWRESSYAPIQNTNAQKAWLVGSR
jgi:hypothetical protein